MKMITTRLRSLLRIRAPAGVTVYAILIFTVICTLIFTLIKSAIFSATAARIDSACSLASEAAFAGYSNKVFDEYGIFVLKNDASATTRMNEVLSANMRGSQARLKNTYITDQVFMTDNGGEPFYKEAVDYMQNESFTDYISSLSGELSDSRKISGLENMGKISESISSMANEGLTDEALNEKFAGIEQEVGAALGESDSHGNFVSFMKDDLANGKSIRDEMRAKEAEGVEYVRPEKDQGKLNGFRNIQRFLKGDLTGLVLGGKSVSGRNSDLNEKNETLTGSGYKGEGLGENIAFTEYLFLKYKSFTDVNGAEGRGANPIYELEYIASGKDNDRDNLNAVMKKLVLIRQGLNMLHIMSDAGKRGESDTFAYALFGWTLNPLIIKAGSYAIMAAWSYAEAISDLRSLYDGKKVPVYKTTATWNLSLEKMLAGDLAPAAGNGDTGLDYEMYLRGILELIPAGTKCARAMDVIDMRMRDRGDTDFRMSNCIFSQVMFASYVMPYSFVPYEREYEYAYSVR